MGFKNFRLVCGFRVGALLATIALFFYVLAYTDLTAALILLALAVVFQTWTLVRFVDSSNRDVSRFLQSVKYSDFSLTYADVARGGTHDELRNTFNDVLTEFRRTRAEKQESLNYLHTVVQHSGVGLLAFSPDGTVDLSNTAVKRILGVTRLRNIKDLEKTSPRFVEALISLEPGRRRLQKIERDGESMQLSISAAGFKIGEKSIKLVSVQNITSELVEKESDAWQQLVRVLTHEIMNSVTPIASLASTAREMLDSSGVTREDDLDRETMDDLLSAVQTIEIRSEGLLRFVDAYRSLTRIPRPEFQIVSASDLLRRIRQLVVSRSDASDIEVTVSVNPVSLELTADPDLVEQVLINLTTNAVQALLGRTGGAIELGARMNDRGQVAIDVADNGPGIREETLENLFVPFFTTKPEGTGIGLSLSRRIMRLHNGELTVASVPDEKTTFTLRF
jgi:nitrogen fixation/metabolism regulation signal transduction histidine kinase